MDEMTTLYQVTGAGFGLFIASFLYSLGGRINKAIRRYGASFVLAGVVNYISFLRDIWNPWLLIIWPILIGGFSLGYGADLPFQKFIRRLVYASAILMSGIVFCLTVSPNCWWVLIPHAGIGLWSIYMGVKNPIEAAAEEFFICMMLNMGLMMYPFVGGL